jgi:hypothetical protein
MGWQTLQTLQVFSFLVVLAKPFRLRRMYHLERLASWSNILTLTLLLVFLLERANAVKLVAGGLVLVINTAVVCRIVAQVWCKPCGRGGGGAHIVYNVSDGPTA